MGSIYGLALLKRGLVEEGLRTSTPVSNDATQRNATQRNAKKQQAEQHKRRLLLVTHFLANQEHVVVNLFESHVHLF